MIIVIAFIVGIFVAGWGALIVQALAGGGDRTPYFATELELRAKPEDDNIVALICPFIFVESNGEKVQAPQNLESDGASVGKPMEWPIVGLLIRWLIKGGPLEGPLRPAAVSHDGLYARATDATFWRALISPARAYADRVIYEAATCEFYRIDGTIVRRKALARWRAFIVMAILRLVGSAAWIEDSVASRSLARKH